MWQCAMIIFLVLGVVQIDSASTADYIKACSKTKDFQSCAIKNGNAAIPHLLKGVPALKIPNLLPLKFPEVSAEPGPNLKIRFFDVALVGIDTVTLKDINVDFQKNTAYIALDAARIGLVGGYEIDGKIMVLPVQGKGNANITLVNSHFKYIFSFKLEKRGGKEYAIVQDDDKLEYKIGKAYFQLDNLFNGNKAMGDNVNTFLNENDQDVIKELGGVIEETVRAVAKTVGGGVLGNIPFSELFLD